jgi:hypothetical protein
MREKILRHYNSNGKYMPDFGILFCGDRAIVSYRPKESSPQHHETVYYGFIFWFRLASALKKVVNNTLTQTP